MDYRKKLTIVLSIILILVIIFAIFISNKSDEIDYSEQKDDIYEVGKENIKAKSNKIQKVSNLVDLNTVKMCIQKYYMNYYSINSDNSEYYKEATYSMLSDEYITKNNIKKEELTTTENMENLNIEILNIFVSSSYKEDLAEYGNVKLYFVNGIVRNLTDNTGKEFNMAIALDNINSSFEIWLSDFVNMPNIMELKENDNVEFTMPESIEKNEYNVFSTFSTSMADIAKYRFDIVRNLLMYDVDKAYSLLDSSLKTEEYANIEDFKKFCNENRSKIFLMTYSTYQVKYENGNVVMKCYDKNDDFCISIYCNEFTSFTYTIEFI